MKLLAKPGAEEALASFIAGALPLVEAEPGTTTWIAYRTAPATFWIVDTNPDESGRQEHLNGQVPAALTGRADELLAAEPEFHLGDVLAAKPASAA
ncbi:MAG: putative quinol monooxygenase [Nocardioides sp.]